MRSGSESECTTWAVCALDPSCYQRLQDSSRIIWDGLIWSDHKSRAQTTLRLNENLMNFGRVATGSRVVVSAVRCLCSFVASAPLDAQECFFQSAVQVSAVTAMLDRKIEDDRSNGAKTWSQKTKIPGLKMLSQGLICWLGVAGWCVYLWHKVSSLMYAKLHLLKASVASTSTLQKLTF